MNQKKKKSFKEKAKEAVEKAKQFYNDHKEEIWGIGAIILTAVLCFATKGDENSDDEYSRDDLSRLSFDELSDAREYVQVNPQEFGESREFILGSIDSVLKNVVNPRREYAKTLSDDELRSELEEAREQYYEEYETYKNDKRPYSELIQDPEYREYKKDYDKFYQLMLEKEHRYAEANPDKFPRHREHGFNLYKEDDD